MSEEQQEQRTLSPSFVAEKRADKLDSLPGKKRPSLRIRIPARIPKRHADSSGHQMPGTILRSARSKRPRSSREKRGLFFLAIRTLYR